jgi:hypothetical protein
LIVIITIPATERTRVQLAADEVNGFPPEIRDQFFDWARTNGLRIPDPARPVLAISFDLEGTDRFMHVAEAEMDPESEYDSHVRKVFMGHPLPRHLLPYCSLLKAAVNA